MYIRTNARLGYFGAIFNIDKAINANRKYMSSLGWQVHFDDIVSRLLGFTMYTPGEGEFAERVGDWQEKHSLKPDGIIGPNTWAKIKSALGLKAAGLAGLKAPVKPTSACSKSFTVSDFRYATNKLTPSQKKWIGSIARSIFSGSGKVPPLSLLKEVRIVGYASGTKNLEKHAERRAVSVYEELLKRLKDLGVTFDDIAKITFGTPITKLLGSRGESKSTDRKVVICLITVRKQKPKPTPKPKPIAKKIWNCVHARRSGWIPLDDPRLVFKEIVPGKTRVDGTLAHNIQLRDVVPGVIGDDDRQPFVNTLDRPYRWVCKLQLDFGFPGSSDLDYMEGTGVLIGNRHLLTNAHNVLEKGSGRTSELRSVVVIPGLNGIHSSSSRAMPFGWTWGTAFRTTTLYRKFLCESGLAKANEDFAVIRLTDDLGNRAFSALSIARFGYWGHPTLGKNTLIKTQEVSSLRGVHVNILGYPADKCRDQPVGRTITQTELDSCSFSDWASVPWLSYERITHPGKEGAHFDTMSVEHDITPGVSGSPVWLRWKGFRNMIGLARSVDIKRKINTVVRFTEPALKEIFNWIR